MQAFSRGFLGHRSLSHFTNYGENGNGERERELNDSLIKQHRKKVNRIMMMMIRLVLVEAESNDHGLSNAIVCC